MDDITVLIPCYNGEKTIKQCIDSVLAQTYSQEIIKIIVANDGSTDTTLEILQSYQSMLGINKFTIVNQENKGLSETRNVLIKLVKTKWFIFLDADDHYTKKAFAQMFNTIKNKNDIDMICSKNNWYRWGVFHRGIFANLFKKKTTLDQYIANADYGYLWNKIYRTNFFISNSISSLPGLIISEDLYLTTLILDKKPNIAFCNHHTYFYAKSKNNMSASLTVKKCEMFVIMLKNIIDKTNNNRLIMWAYISMLLWCSIKIKTDNDIKNIVMQLNKLIKDKSIDYKLSLWKIICYNHVKKYFSI